MSQTDKSFPELLREAMNEASASVADLFRATGVSERAIRYYLDPKRKLKQSVYPEKVARLAIALGRNPVDWCAAAGVKLSQFQLRSAQEAVGLRRTGGDPEKLMDLTLPVTVEDLKYLLEVQKGLQQPMTLGLLTELVQRRKPKSQ